MNKFAHITVEWEKLVDNFRKWYIPSSYITIDEQFTGFRGRYFFRMYIPIKINKYIRKPVIDSWRCKQ